MRRKTTIYDQDGTPLLGTGPEKRRGRRTLARALAMGPWGEIVDTDTGEIIEDSDLEEDPTPPTLEG